MSNPRILILDHTPTSTQDLSTQLMAAGCSVMAHLSTWEAAACLLGEQSVDLVLATLHFVPQINQQPCPVPVVYLSQTNEQATQIPNQPTAIDILTLPISTESLVLTLKTIIERSNLTQRLSRVEVWMQTMLANVSDGVVAIDQHGKIQWINSAAEHMTGWDYRSALQQDFNQVVVIRSSLNDQRIDVIAAALRNEPVFALPFERYLHARDGHATSITEHVTPLLNNDGQNNGAIVILRDHTAQLQMEEALYYQSLHDSLTGLPNRRSFQLHLSRALEYQRHHHDYSFAIILLDIDEFKMVNDGLGYHIGDTMLTEIAQRLRRALYLPGDVVARFDGDEFAIFFDRLPDLPAAFNAAQRIRQLFEDPFMIENGQEIFCNVSIGLELITSEVPIETVMRNADLALYRAKHTGRGGIEIFDQTLYANFSTRLHNETALRLALQRQEFRLFAQPIIDFEHSHCTGFEILIRWAHPDGRLRSPGQFLDIAEETGLIIPLGWWMLEVAAEQLERWQADSMMQHMTLAINLSPRQLLHSQLLPTLKSIFERYQFPRQQLHLEITEGALLNTERAEPILNALRHFGLHLHIDDFGTGYSSLTYLHRFPLNTIKIDRSFIQAALEDQRSLAIVRTIINLAQTMQLATIAEGIETAEHIQVLRELGCQAGQGYFFSPPVPLEQAADFACSLN
ncbi:MAG TPA: GGDEF domain-containing protein [Herpetosiphon sp.]|uniref:Diguanylate cyclase/phosphodiesterase with PAS/PAC sensor(S) n=1 Tax=Herpetosiphon aurantiacus (strain ATCC 23779 / DSM 785 / 114-95) TaxID=316274 RepID=A9AW40_HERA2|nr:GGDEF domain-containing phosphodiesterase [Herpetosiphon sp.]ABX03278.1 diguanylate cyclase/phosphodiesterase with PAS/PAC sensor(s) [Herpetosiphon aurantiacus DSM 785]HBW52574.1 GGDEF domain-containing protein [Herpetosiphon sp.]